MLEGGTGAPSRTDRRGAWPPQPDLL